MRNRARRLRTGAFAAALVVCIAAPEASTQEPYPWHTVSLDTHAAADVTWTLGGSPGTGGALLAGVSIRSSALGGARAILESGYGYGQTSPITTRSEVPIRLTAGYAFVPAGLVSLTPLAGAEIGVAVSSSQESRFSVLAGGQVEALLHERTKAFLKVMMGTGFTAANPPRIAVGIGIRKSVPFMVPLPKMGVQITLPRNRFSPDGDGFEDDLIFHVSLERPESVREWQIGVHDAGGALLYSDGRYGPPPGEVRWDGRTEDGEVVQQATEYRVDLRVIDKIDRAAGYSGPIVTDIFVTKQGDRYVIQVPFITFPPNSADLSLLDEKSAADNRRVLEQVARIIGRFPEYRVLVEGHANIEFYDDPERREQEQREVLIPLSAARAQAVRNALVDLGISSDRLAVSGVGGERPIVPFSDEENRWKNRRVEFILIRNESTQ